jgi:1-deoxy-D-xylulose-5-phosphate reductoisomerase
MGNVRRVIILGSTGSIGTQALEVIAANPDRFRVVGLSAGSQGDMLADQARAFGVTHTALGAEASEDLVREVDADVVLNGMTGAVGLGPTLATLERGMTLALANKESLIIGGKLVMGAASPGQIVPVDSEHSAIAQCLVSGTHAEVRRLILTASGGPFRGRSRDQLGDVTPQQALAHPTWDMGLMVTTNSATLMNKGLEVIEAHELFGVPAGDAGYSIGFDEIDVVVHPQSIVHSMVEFTDASTIAQLSTPDMRLPIGYALAWPDRITTPFGCIDWSTLGRLDFEPPNLKAFPCLALAYDAGRAGGTAPAWISAANEVAVDAFLQGQIAWRDIAAIIAATLDRHDGAPATDAPSVIEADAQARRVASEELSRFATAVRT